ncbi:hypothetical protein [Mycolicibacterium goodii]|uniref:hypothetical protein n=1 Tax=Mycolicibacterium goodii TaxID=134601 RepID=UPI001BDD8ED0|nr:hypothetical protein [Mycolicibacterium goodii]MBU8830833.1 hypothetical protein [Mycolicibacterium goodii]
MLSLEHGIEAPLFRPVTDFGETVYPEVPTRKIEKVGRRINAPVRVNDAGGQAYLQTGLLYVYRSEDVQDGDKIRLPEGDFIVRGRAENDMLHPMNGHDFGVKRYNIEGA